MNAYAFETWEIPLNPPLLKEDFKSSPKQVWEKKSMRSSYECIRTFIRIIRCKLFPAPLSKYLYMRTNLILKEKGKFAKQNGRLTSICGSRSLS
jgi:hypothetical protein